MKEDEGSNEVISYRQRNYTYYVDLWIAVLGAIAPFRPMVFLAIVAVWPLWLIAKSAERRRDAAKLAAFSLSVGLLARIAVAFGFDARTSVVVTFPLLFVSAWLYWRATCSRAEGRRR